MNDVNETKTEEVTAPTTTPEPTAPPTDDGKDGFRRQLSEQGTVIKELKAQLEAREAADKARDLADLEKREEYKALYDTAKSELEQVKRDGKRAALENKLLSLGVVDEVKRLGLMATYDHEADANSFVEELQAKYPTAFEPDKAPTRSAGVHGAVATSPTQTTEATGLAQMYKSGNAVEMIRAADMVAEKLRAGDITKAEADAILGG